jgi:hypothetical protein
LVFRIVKGSNSEIYACQDTIIRRDLWPITNQVLDKHSIIYQIGFGNGYFTFTGELNRNDFEIGAELLLL